MLAASAGGGPAAMPAGLKQYNLKGLLMAFAKKVSLRSFISREFFKAALLPLLIIEITLLVLYFFMNTYLLEKSIRTLIDDRLSNLLEITGSQTRTMSEQLHAVSDLSLVIQAETRRFFEHPEQFPSSGPGPEFGFARNNIYYKLENNGGCSLFYSGAVPVEAAQKDKALRSEALDPVYKGIFNANHNIVAVYLNTFDSMNRYYPFFEDVYDQVIPGMDIPEFNFYYLADRAHNPDGGPVWTDTYLDPMGMGWMMSCIVPVYNGEFLEGVAGIDVTITKFIDNLLALQLPWGAHAFLVDAGGTIMAMPPDVEGILGLNELYEFSYDDKVEGDTRKPETFNLLATVPLEAREQVAGLMQRTRGSAEISLGGNDYILCQNSVAESGWRFMVIADRAAILSPVSSLERHARHVGYAAIGFMCLFYALFFLYLVRNTGRMSERIAGTLGGLSSAIKRLGTGVYETEIISSPVAELETLSSNFESMARDLKTLHENLEQEVMHANRAEDIARQAEAQLKEHKTHLERLVASRTLELTKTNEKLQGDILRRKQAEAALDLERRQLLSIFDSIDEAVYISCPETYELLYVNEAMKKYWPSSLGGKCYEVLQQKAAPCDFCTNDILFKEKPGDPCIWEHYNHTTDRWFRCIDKAIQWPDGRMVRYEMAIDITGQKRAAEEKQRLMARLRRAEKMEALGTLAGGVAHDLNNVLGGIVGYPDLILMDLPQDSPLRRSVEMMKKSGQRASAIVQDLLTLARRGVPSFEVVNVNDIIAGYLRSPEHNRLMQKNPDIDLKCDLATELLCCKGSLIHLLKMVMNLVINAAEALPDGGDIVLSTRNRYVDRPLKGYDDVQEGDYIVLKVVDSGVGILPEDLERIFEPFYTKKKMGRSGTGLGMSVVWGTVKDHRGYIEVQSTPEVGTTIEIYLPATREAPEHDGRQPALAAPGGSETILVVDDVEVQRDIAVGMLEKLGYEAVAVSSGEAAVKWLSRKKADLVLLDMIMEPNIDGLETYKRILKLHPGQKAIIASGYSETAAIRETQALGAGKYVKKPYTIDELGKAVREELLRR
jgi:signal transduction histidine kinase